MYYKSHWPHQNQPTNYDLIQTELTDILYESYVKQLFNQCSPTSRESETLQLTNTTAKRAKRVQNYHEQHVLMILRDSNHLLIKTIWFFNIGNVYRCLYSLVIYKVLVIKSQCLAQRILRLRGLDKFSISNFRVIWTTLRSHTAIRQSKYRLCRYLIRFLKEETPANISQLYICLVWPSILRLLIVKAK